MNIRSADDSRVQQNMRDLIEFNNGVECDNCHQPIRAHADDKGTCLFSPGTVYARTEAPGTILNWDDIIRHRLRILGLR